MACTVIARFTVPGFHSWPDAPEAFSFLRERHRHVFHFEVGALVTHDNRAIELITWKEKLRSLVQRTFCHAPEAAAHADFGRYSCESIARKVLERTEEACYVAVFEDGENGARVER